MALLESRYVLVPRDRNGGGTMNRTSDNLWLAFQAVAKTYPNDEGVRLTADLARWLLLERNRRELPVPSMIEKVVRTVAPDLNLQSIEV